MVRVRVRVRVRIVLYEVQRHPSTHQRLQPACVYTSGGEAGLNASFQSLGSAFHGIRRRHVQVLEHRSSPACILLHGPRVLTAVPFVGTGECVFTLTGHEFAVTAIAISKECSLSLSLTLLSLLSSLLFALLLLFRRQILAVPT